MIKEIKKFEVESDGLEYDTLDEAERAAIKEAVDDFESDETQTIDHLIKKLQEIKKVCTKLKN